MTDIYLHIMTFIDTKWHIKAIEQCSDGQLGIHYSTMLTLFLYYSAYIYASRATLYCYFGEKCCTLI